ncbi:MAG: bifunctional 4-hydroxy-2-oxoglutarate aldolase/2-dehydro-3-deoxy-phosphogluconate aldolase [Thermomicrobiales bacterium]
MNVSETVSADGVVAIVRLDDLSGAVPMTQALVDGGIRAVEFTFTNRTAPRAIEATREALDGTALVGAGTVLDAETARTAILAGAQFIVTPVVSIPVIECCRRYSIPTVIGAFTATEILTAWQAGAEFVKVFPASAGGPRYLKDIRGPLPQVRLIPTGGVSAENAAEFIKAGASAVALGSNLVDPKLVAAKDWAGLSARARSVVEVVRQARG